MSSSALRARPSSPAPNDLQSFWLPFTANRAFKQRPRLIARAKDMHYYTPEGRPILDATAGLWCCNAGHNRQPDRRGDPGTGGRARFRPYLSIRAIRAHSRRRLDSPNLRPAISTRCSSAIPDRKRRTPR